jgi:ubiquinone/menaquinone biosynthesis C-methylase UbiE
VCATLLSSQSKGSSSPNILNLGCGQQHYGTIRLDINRGAANIVADVEMQLPFKNEVFDTIYTRFLIEHVRNPGLFLKEIVRVLKPGGKLILITDNAAYPPFHLPPVYGSGFHVGGYKGQCVADKHYSLYTIEHLGNHLEYVGLKVQQLDYVYADDIGSKSGIWQKTAKRLKLHNFKFAKPFCMANILAIGTKPQDYLNK